jgi:hypothetical protein
VFALLGFLSPSNRGALGTVIILFYTFFGFIGGYVSARVYKFFNGEGWKRNFIYTPVFLPVIVFAVFFLMNLFVWARGASGAVPFGTMLVLVLLWFLISVPLSLVGSWIGFKAQPVSTPTRTNQIPRQIPPASGYLRPVPSMLLAGVLPFGAIFVELYFIMNSIWFNKFYYMFGFLFICFGLMIMTCATVTVLMIYFLLCAENYHWQWRSFFTAGASAFYVFVSAMLFWLKGLSFSNWTSGVLYLGYSLLISALVFLLTGQYYVGISKMICQNADDDTRDNRILLVLDIRAQDLWFDQGGLIGKLQTEWRLLSVDLDLCAQTPICCMKYTGRLFSLMALETRKCKGIKCRQHGVSATLVRDDFGPVSNVTLSNLF